MLQNLSHHWWLLALRGALAILFGILAFAWPSLTLGALVILYGIYAIVDGIAGIVMSISHRHVNDRWWALLISSIVSVLAGIVTFVLPGMTVLILLTIIAIWAILSGILDIVSAIRLREEIEGEWALGLSGLASLLFGIIMLFRPGAGALTIVWLIAIYAILFGALLIYLAFQLRKVKEEPGRSLPQSR